MKYYAFECDNGYCGFNETFCYEVDDDITEKELEEIANEVLWNDYDFCEPDQRCVDVDNEEECQDYYDGLSVFYHEITEEEYSEYH